MPQQAVNYVFNHVMARPFPTILPGQRSNAQGQIPAGGSSEDAGGAAASNNSPGTITDTHLLVGPANTFNSIDRSAATIGKQAHVAAFADVACEIRLLFGGFEGATGALTVAQMLQVADYPPLFVPAGTTQWTVYRNIVLHDRFFLPILFNLTAGATTTWRMHIVITDRLI